jgi:hypothetical protein
MPNFAFVEDRGQNYSLINIDQIRLITSLADGHCKIIFETDFTVEVHGPAADQLFAQLLVDSKMPDGTPMMEWIEKYKAEKITSTNESHT